MTKPLIYISCILLFCTCRKDEYETFYNPVDKEYFNTQVGSYLIFNVNEIIFDDFTNTSDTLMYQLREMNESIFKDNLGREAIRIDRHVRDSDTSAWKYLNTWYAVSDSKMVERVEQNKRLVKLSFPISNEAVWDANAFNSENANNVFYSLMHENYSQDTFTFDSVVSVKSTPRITFSTERVFEEVYAKNIGLVYKYHVQVDRAGIIRRGFKIEYRLYQHGN